MAYIAPVDWLDILERKKAPPGFERIDEDAIRQAHNDQIAQDLMKHAEGLHETWINLSYQEPPKDLIGRILWSLGVWGQMVISIATFPAALGNFLMEESVQSYGMGAYMLSTGKQWETLDWYLDGYRSFIDASEVGVKTLATLNPTTGGAVLMYMGAARMGQIAFRVLTDAKLLEQAEKDDAYRERLLDDQKYGSLVIRSSPTNAEIWIDGENTEYLTSETFKRMEEKNYIIELRKYSKKREVWDIYSFSVDVTPGRKKEMFIHIPEMVTDEEETPGQAEEDDTGQLPDFLNAEVTGDYAVDGDTFQTTAGERIRILGIDTPEMGRPWADMAKEYTYSLIEDKKIQLRIQTHLPIDAYGRTLAICESYKGNIAILLLSAGLARAFIADDARYDPARYLEAERVARDRRIGIWSEMP